MTVTLGHIDYLANQIYQESARAEGYPCGVRWWCLREDKRAYYLRMAEAHYTQWRDDEAAQLQRSAQDDADWRSKWPSQSETK